MKLICIDIENCGFYSKVEDLEEKDHQNICPSCFGLAITTLNNYNPLIDSDQNNEEKDLQILRFYNALNEHEQKLLEAINKKNES